MEGKKRLSAATAATAWCLLLAAVLLSGQPRPVAGMSKFCRCYKKCYADCRKDSGPYPCNFGFLQDCVNGALLPPARPKSAADCNRICLVRVYGIMSTVAGGGDGDAQACLVDCRNSIGYSAAHLKDDTAN